MIILAVAIITACTSATDDNKAKTDVTQETFEKIEQAQDVNIELEEIDGELDSLLNTIK